LSINRQLQLLAVPRSSYYYRGRRAVARVASDESAKDAIMDIYLDTPFYGVPRLTAELKRRGYKVNHKRVRRPRFNTSEPHPEHKKYPYLLRGLDKSVRIRSGPPTSLIRRWPDTARSWSGSWTCSAAR